MVGKPVIAGTRIPVDLILLKLGAGESMEEVLEGYPHITREQLLATLTYASEIVRSEALGLQADRVL